MVCYSVITQQALFSSYAGLAILGCTDQYFAPLNLDPAFIARSATPQGRAALAEEILSALPQPYLEGPREHMLSWFHLADVPAEVVEADSVTTRSVVPRVFGTAMIPGVVAASAAQVDVPVFIGYGAVDVSPEPRAEARLYRNSPGIHHGRAGRKRALPQHGLEPASVVAANAHLGRDRHSPHRPCKAASSTRVMPSLCRSRSASPGIE
jgi:hypothetical protein